jgi:hypothetical protein
MPKKKTSSDGRLESVAILLAALVLGRKPSIQKLAKIVGIRPSDLIEILGKEPKASKNENSKK